MSSRWIHLPRSTSTDWVAHQTNWLRVELCTAWNYFKIDKDALQEYWQWKQCTLIVPHRWWWKSNLEVRACLEQIKTMVNATRGNYRVDCFQWQSLWWAVVEAIANFKQARWDFDKFQQRWCKLCSMMLMLRSSVNLQQRVPLWLGVQAK